MNLQRILVLCTGNICRSPMAEGLFRERLADTGDRFVVESAGTGALVEHPADPIAVELMSERSIDISGHRARQLSAAMTIDFDLLLVMETGQREHVEKRWPLAHGRVHELGRWGDFQIDDPYRQPRDAFEEALDRIDRGVREWLTVIDP